MGKGIAADPWIKANEYAEHPTMHKKASATKNHLVQNITNVPVGNSMLEEENQVLRETLVFKYLGGGEDWSVKKERSI